jgi:hypothetical protein
MRPSLLALTTFAAAALAAPPAYAVTCYQVLDRNDNVVYQDIFPPLDLSEAGEAERRAMRARNEHMIAMESDRCPRLELIAGPGVGLSINLEEMGDALSSLNKPSGGTATAPAAKSGTNPAAAPKPKAAKPAAKPAAPAN